MNTDTLRLYIERFRGDEPTGEEQLIAHIATLLRTDRWDFPTLSITVEEMMPEYGLKKDADAARQLVHRAIKEWYSDPEKEDY